MHEGVASGTARKIDDFAYLVVSRTQSWGAVPRSAVPLYRDEIFDDDLDVLRSSAKSGDDDVGAVAASAGPMSPLCDCTKVGHESSASDDLGEFTTLLSFDLRSPKKARKSDVEHATIRATQGCFNCTST